MTLGGVLALLLSPEQSLSQGVDVSGGRMREVTLEVRDRMMRPVPSVVVCVPAKTQCGGVPVRAAGGSWVATLAPDQARLRVEAPGFRAGEVDLTSTATTAVVHLPATGAVTLHLTSFDQHREQEITVTLAPGDSRSSAKARALDEKVLVVPPRPRKSVLTLVEVPPGRYTLRWSGSSVARDTRELVISPDGAAVTLRDLRLAAGVTIEGAVRDTVGTPLPAAKVRLVDPERLDGSARVVETGADGWFEIIGIPLGAPLKWTVSAEGHEGAVGVWAGETRLEVVLDAAQRVSGVVVDDHGEALPGAEILLVLKGPGTSGSRPFAKADAAGRFSGFRPRQGPDEKHGLRVTANGWLVRVVELPDGKTPRELDLGEVPLEKGLSVRGHVSEAATGFAVEDASITVRSVPAPGDAMAARPRPLSSARSRADGSFEVFGVLDTEELVAFASKEGWAPVSKRVRGERESVELALTRGGRIAGRVCGTPAELEQTRVIVSSTAPGLSPVPETRLDGSGEFVLDLLEPGDYSVGTVWVHREGGFRVGGEGRQVVTIHEGKTTEVSLECSGIQVSGTVLLAGRPVANALGSFAMGNVQSMNLKTNAAGEFALRVNAAGTYSASVIFGLPTSEGMLQQSSACVVPAGGATVCTMVLTLTPETGPPRPQG